MKRFVRRTGLAALFLGVAPAIMLAAATPAHAWSFSVWGNYHACTADQPATPDQRRIERAIRGCTGVIDSQRASREQYHEALVRRGTLRLSRNDVSGASSDLQLAYDINDREPRTLLALGQVQKRLNNPDAALESLNAAVRHAGEDAAIAYEAQITLGDLHMMRQDWDRARTAYGAAYNATEDEAQRTRARIGRGNAKFSDGDVDGAIADYRSCTETSIEAVLALAGAYRHQAAQGDADSGQFNAAKRQYEAAVERAAEMRDSAEQRRLLARGYVGLGLLHYERFTRQRGRDDLRTALENYNEAVERDPQYTPALTGRARTLAYMPDGQRQAIADLDHALQLQPNDADVLRQRGQLYETSGLPEVS